MATVPMNATETVMEMGIPFVGSTVHKPTLLRLVRIRELEWQRRLPVYRQMYRHVSLYLCPYQSLHVPTGLLTCVHTCLDSYLSIPVSIPDFIPVP